ncbi:MULTISPECIES: glycosyltransferase family 2 protein [unclassified Desulfurobacterium]|uniref:glycosyltransferase family 2 protein n=1 Tax=Desulfurobacterium sp. TC5-1 TaxID=1158318 RepID=UPI0003B6E8F9|nr:glycosyltransferase family 2 protein [Desulfurobacterium sp. TC5-1]
MTTLSVSMIVKNGEKYLSDVLRSVEDLADEIIVVDSGSTDKTVEIAKSYGAKVVFRKFDNFINQKNYALSLCTKDWVLFLDDDEVVDEKLKREIELVKKQNSEYKGFYINRLTNYLGKWIKHAWYPDWQLRLARRDSCRWEGDEVHETLKVNGKTGYLKGNLLHYSYPDIETHLKKLNLYTTLYAKGTHKRGKRFSKTKLITSSIGAFIRRYFIKKGFLDGFEGFVVSVMSSYYTFLKYLKLWEIEKRSEKR